MFKNLQNRALVLCVVLAPIGAQAAFVVPPEIAEAGTNAGLVGVAVLGVIVAIRAFKWIRRAL